MTNQSLRVTDHPILEDPENQRRVTIYFDGRPLEAVEGEPIAAALLSNGVRAFRRTVRLNEPRGVFCAIGRCTDCMMIVDGQPNVRTCVTPVREGMRLESQIGLGVAVTLREGKNPEGESAAGAKDEEGKA